MSTTKKNPAKDISRDVLFQKIGQTWFIFSEAHGEVVYSVMPDGMDPRTTKLELYQVIEDHMARVAANKQRGPMAEAV